MAQTLRSSLLFIDSDYNHDGSGDEFNVDIPSNAISCADRQFIRLILQEFHAYKNFYNVNVTNNTLRLNINGGGFNDVVIPASNYETYNEIADALADQLVSALTTAGLTYTKGTVLPVANKIPSSTSNRILSITLTNGGAAATSFVLQAREISGTYGSNEFSDSFALLGGKKITSSTDTTTQSFSVSIDGGTGNITIVGYFPMQRSTCEHIYLRTSLVNNNLGSKSTHTGGNHGQDLSGTNILAKIPVQSEFIAYASDSGTGYFVDIPLRNLTHIQFTITDHKNRRLPQVSAGQATLGNMNYTFVVRVDIVSYGPSPQPNELLAPKPQLPQQNLSPYLQDGAPARRRIPF